MGFYCGLFWVCSNTSFINHLDAERESKLMKSADDIKLAGVINTLKDCTKIQRDLDKLKN